MNDYSFGNFLYTLRKEKQLSQSQLGEMLGVTNKAVSKWENGSAKPNTILIPKIAEILGVSVEELFACKRFEKDHESERIKKYLSEQKKKYAILYSIFLSVIIVLPLLLVEFICIVIGFRLPDDVAGPLGAVGFIFLFVISITALIIYRKNFNQALSPSKLEYSKEFAEFIRKALWISAILWWFIFALLFSVYALILRFSWSFTIANIFLSITAFILIMLLGFVVFLGNLKRLLRIKFLYHPAKEEHKKIRFADLPAWAKLYYITALALTPILLSLHILSFLNNDLKNLFVLKITVFLIWSMCVFALIFYRNKKK
ncbi:MAG: helix-turn-helix transcriptional regulator [Clostridia bacterium]|nr:helix-turn-helix transcriptional regulator [Clostridia bacterium]